MHALCSGGIDHPSNMNWITVDAHKAKTRQDVRWCRASKRNRPSPGSAP